MRLLILTFLILTAWSLTNCLPIDPSSNFTEYRLPTNIYPTNYDLFITTFLPGYGWPTDERNLSFEGNVIINMEVKETTDKIVIHAVQLDIINCFLLSESVNGINRWELIPDLQILTIYLDKEVHSNETIGLFVSFKGKLRTDLKGYYITKSKSKTREEMINAVTQFEPTAARFMIPCFDEPEFKATWQVTLQHPKGSVALTNTIETGSELFENFVVTEFEKTVKMSSYLLAIFVGDVQFKETTTNKGLRIRVYADPLDIDHVGYALNVSRATVEGFEKLFGIDYPMKKLDFVCAHFFEAGAMENWGLIVHRPSLILGESDDVADTVIHELAHQWFGNLVTMKFWDQVWLNEGFATYMTSYGQSYINPKFDRAFDHVRTQFAAEAGDNKVALDGVFYSKDGSIGIPGIIYPKGSSFLRMLEKLIGEENFIEAIKMYLYKNSYSNAEDTYLYESLGQFFNKSDDSPSLEEFAMCWTHQNGYPTVYVKNINGTITLTQENDVRIDPRFNFNNACGYKWDIPIWYQEVGKESIELKWFLRDQDQLELNVQGPVIVNANSNGYYDVVYSDEFYEIIAMELKNNSQLYSDSTKLRLLFNVAEYSRTNKTSFHNTFIIADSLTSSENVDILLNVRDILSTLPKLSDSEKHVLKTFTNKLSEKTIFEKCEPSENFSSCFEKSFSTEHDACLSVAIAKNASTTDRLIRWLNQTDPAESRERILNMLHCGDNQTFKTVVNDTSYNWSEFERYLIHNLLRFYTKRKSALSKNSRNFNDFDAFVKPFLWGI